MPNYAQKYIVYGLINHKDNDNEVTWISQPMNISGVINHIKQVMYDEVYLASSFVFTVVAHNE